jgi:hypothetical protein
MITLAQYIKAKNIVKKFEKENGKFPTNPELIYNNENFSWVDFLGADKIAPKNRTFISYDEAKDIVQPLSLKSLSDWRVFTQAIEFKEFNLPKNPSDFYKGKGWTSWGDFLGTGKILPKNKTFLSYDEAKELVKSLDLKSYSDWQTFIKVDKFKNLNLPYDPCKIYKGKGWTSWGEFLGTGYISYEKAKEIVHPLNLKSKSNWIDYLSCSKKMNIENFLSYQEAREYISKNVIIDSRQQWAHFTKSENFPKFLPKNPHIYYKDKWQSWSHFLDN